MKEDSMTPNIVVADSSFSKSRFLLYTATLLFVVFNDFHWAFPSRSPSPSPSLLSHPIVRYTVILTKLFYACQHVNVSWKAVAPLLKNIDMS